LLKQKEHNYRFRKNFLGENSSRNYPFNSINFKGFLKMKKKKLKTKKASKFISGQSANAYKHSEFFNEIFKKLSDDEMLTSLKATLFDFRCMLQENRKKYNIRKSDIPNIIKLFKDTIEPIYWGNKMVKKYSGEFNKRIELHTNQPKATDEQVYLEKGSDEQHTYECILNVNGGEIVHKLTYSTFKELKKAMNLLNKK